MESALNRLVAGIALVILAPLFIIVGILILIDSKGPIFFRQKRIGLAGEPFRIHKFRTMRVQPIKVNVSAAGDPRVTRVGRILRKTKLDELPQLIDIVQGKMAFVGPRPEVPEYVAQWPSQARPQILSVLPGITDPASIKYRNEADELATAEDPEKYYIENILPKKTALYVNYVEEKNFWGDIYLILQTIRTVIK